MKKSIVAALVLVACLLVAPFGFGKLAEKRLNSTLDTAVAKTPYVVLKERTWQGGWFKSRQELTFEVAPAFAAIVGPDLGEKLSSLKMVNDVVHGPVLGAAGFGLARVDTTFDLPEEVLARIREIFGPEPVLEVHSRLGFFSGGSTTFSSKGRTIQPEGGAIALTYEDFQLVMAYGKNVDTFTMEGGLPGLEVKGLGGGSLRLAGLTVTSDGKRVQGELYDSDLDARVATVEFTGATPAQSVSVADLHYVVDSESDDGFTTWGGKIGSGAVKAAQIDATGLDIKEVHYDFSMRHLHTDTLEKLVTAMQDMYKNLPAEGADPEAAMALVQQQVIAPMVEHGAELLKHDPELGLDRIGLVTADGEAVLRGVIKLAGATLEDFSPTGYMNLIGKVDADITFEIAQKLADKIPNGAVVLGIAVSQGYVTREGEKLVCHIEFRNGELKINGKAQAIPIPGMVAPPPGGAAFPPEA